MFDSYRYRAVKGEVKDFGKGRERALGRFEDRHGWQEGFPVMILDDGEVPSSRTD